MSKRKSNAKRVSHSYYDTEDYQPQLGGQRRTKATDTNVVNFNNYVAHQRRTVTLIPKSNKQEEYVRLLLDPAKLIVFATGPAGTGKTMLAVLAAVKALKEGTCSKIVVTRPAVGVDDEKHGFLPGDLNEKMAPWTRPIFDVMKEYYSPKEISLMLEDEVIEISPLAFMRGRTFKDSWIVADEMQNATPSQLKMLLTRLGDGSKMIITGDTQQTDRKGSSNGLVDFQLRSNNFVGHRFITGVEFTGDDIQRHPAVEEILSLYGDI